MKYRGYEIEPKLDFGLHGYLDSKGKVIRKGWVVYRNGCNVMPGATWFFTVPEAKHGIDIYIRVRGSAPKFWEIMQPFPYKVGQHVPPIPFSMGATDQTITHGRWIAEVVNGVVTKVTKIPWKMYLKHPHLYGA